MRHHLKLYTGEDQPRPPLWSPKSPGLSENLEILGRTPSARGAPWLRRLRRRTDPGSADPMRSSRLLEHGAWRPEGENKKIRMTKEKLKNSKATKTGVSACFAVSYFNFGFPSTFGFRHSEFTLPPPLPLLLESPDAENTGGDSPPHSRGFRRRPRSAIPWQTAFRCR